MTDPLIPYFLPQLSRHVNAAYGWMRHRGNCLITIDDLIQVASIELIKLAEKWDSILFEEGKTRDGNEGLFWTYLKNHTKHAVLKYANNIGARGADDDYIDPEDERTSLRIKGDSMTYGMIRDELCNYFDTLPRKHKAILALRHFDDLMFSEIPPMIGMSKGGADKMYQAARARFRSFARNLYTSEPTEMAIIKPTPWEPTELLETFVHDRHRTDLAGYLWRFSACLRADVSYLTDILGNTYVTAESRAWSRSITPDIGKEIDALRLAGVSAVRIAEELEITESAVWAHVRRPVSVAA